MLDICFVKFKWKIANIFARIWTVSSILSLVYYPMFRSAANFRGPARWNRKSEIISKLGCILKFKPQRCYKLIKTLLWTENEGRLGLELWPWFAAFARFFCAFAPHLPKMFCGRLWRGFVVVLKIITIRIFADSLFVLEHSLVLRVELCLGLKMKFMLYMYSQVFLF